MFLAVQDQEEGLRVGAIVSSTQACTHELLCNTVFDHGRLSMQHLSVCWKCWTTLDK